MFLVMGLWAEVMGQNIIRPKIACPNDIWVNSYNGVLFYQREDVSIPTGGENPLAAVFYYNSSFADTNYGFGNGWSFGYQWWYEEQGDTVRISQGDGRSDNYLLEGDSYKSPAGVFNTLRKESGVVLLTTPEGTVYHFSDPQGKHVTQITDRNGNTLNLSYEVQAGADVPPQLTKIQESNGRALNFEYNQGLLVRLTVGELADHVWTYAYDGKGNLVSVTTPMHHTVYYGYDKENRINRFTNAAGHSTAITYSPNGEANRIKDGLSDMNIRYEHSALKTIVVDYLTDGNNQFTAYRWDSLGRVIEKSGNCCGYTSKLTYDDNDNIVSSKDALDNETTYTYDERGNMLTRTDPLGHTETCTWHPQYNRPVTYTDRAGNLFSYTYDSHGNLTKITGTDGYQVQYTYNNHGQPTKRTDALGNETTYTYDAYGNLTSFTNPLGHTSSYTYDLMGNKLSYTNPSGKATAYSYNAEGRLVSITEPTGAKTIFTYTPGGYVHTITKPGNSLYIYVQDAHGNLVAYNDPTGATTYYTYNAKDQVTAIHDALGNSTQYEYDDRDRLTSITDPLGNSVHYTYDAMGRPTSAAYSNGRTEEYQYDALGQLTQISDNLGIRYQATYNALGKKTQELTATTRTGDSYTYDITNRTYDNRGRLLTVSRPGNQTVSYAYDALNHLTSFTDAGGNTQTFAYDAAGNLVSHTDPMQGTTSMTYDAARHMVTLTDPKGNTTTYAYDDAGRTTLTTFPNNKTEQYTYDQRGNMVKFKDKAGNEIRYTYDAVDHLTSIIYPDGNSDQYAYDALGRRISVSGGGSTVTMTYDALGRTLTEAVATPFATTATTSYAYDDEAGSETITYPNGRMVKTEYDLRNCPSTISSTASPTSPVFLTAATYTIRADNRPEQLTYGNGVTTTYSYGENLRPTAIMAAIGESAPLQYLHMGYDPVGNILSQIDSVSLPRSEFYQYDALGRLTQFSVGTPNSTLTQSSSPTRTGSYNYDALGNRTTTTMTQSGNNAISYASNAVNGYTQVGSQGMQYDGNGNLTSDGVHTYQYDYANLLVSVDNGATATYSYDPMGRRIRKTVGTTTTDYFYAGHQMIESTSTTQTGNSATTQTTTDYVYSPRTDDVLMAWRGDDRYYFHKNRVGHTVAVTDASGNVVERYDYDAFGAPQFFAPNGTERAASAIGNDILFTGREYDSETGLYYYRARTLNPTMGRFLQQDPTGYDDGLNMYAYVYNNPLNFTDPMGLRGSDCGKKNNRIDPIGKTDIGIDLKGCLFAVVGLCANISLGLSFKDGDFVPRPFAYLGETHGFGGDASAGMGFIFDHSDLTYDPDAAWYDRLSTDGYYEGEGTLGLFNVNGNSEGDFNVGIGPFGVSSNFGEGIKYSLSYSPEKFNKSPEFQTPDKRLFKPVKKPANNTANRSAKMGLGGHVGSHHGVRIGGY